MCKVADVIQLVELFVILKHNFKDRSGLGVLIQDIESF